MFGKICQPLWFLFVAKGMYVLLALWHRQSLANRGSLGKLYLILLGAGHVASTSASFFNVTGSSYSQAEFWTSDRSSCKKESSCYLKIEDIYPFTHVFKWNSNRLPCSQFCPVLIYSVFRGYCIDTSSRKKNGR